MNTSKRAIKSWNFPEIHCSFFKWIWGLCTCLVIVTLPVFSQGSLDEYTIELDFKVLKTEEDIYYEKYLRLLDKHNTLQKELLDSLNYFNKIRSKNYVLSGNDINTINVSFSKRIAVLNQSILFFENDLEWSGNKTMYDLLLTHLKIKALETFTLQQQIIGKNIKVNNLLNECNLLYRQDEKTLKKMDKNLLSNRFRVSVLETWETSYVFNDSINNRAYAIKESVINTDYYKDYLSSDEHIKKSKKNFRKQIKKENSVKGVKGSHRFVKIMFWPFTYAVSNVVGNATSRQGKLKNNETFINNSLQLLEPLDVIIDKTPFKLSDKSIPGYWGHAAIYVGNEKQLKALGIWENPFVVKYHQEIIKGNVIVEALRSRVEINSFKQFSNIDDYAQLRLAEEPTPEKKREMLVRVFAQIGKKYDYCFDIESNEKIMCSELHYITFDEIIFNTNKVLGINTITVDQIAEQGLNGGHFYPIDLYLDGIRIDNDKIPTTFNQLLLAKN